MEIPWFAVLTTESFTEGSKIVMGVIEITGMRIRNGTSSKGTINESKNRF